MTGRDADVAVITGAGGGIGSALAREFAGRGYAVALVDVNESAIRHLADAIRAQGGTATIHPADLSDPAAVSVLARDLLASHEHVDLLVNNAGVALIGGFAGMELADFEWLMNVNFWGTVRLTRALLPYLLERPRARIVNLSSVFGLIAPEGQTAYAASKFAIRGFTEALRQELAGTGVAVTVVHPGGVRTGIAASARRSPQISQATAVEMAMDFERSARTTPEQAARVIADGAERGARRVLVGFDARLVDWVQRLFPVRYPAVFRGLYRLLTGRSPRRVAEYGDGTG